MYRLLLADVVVSFYRDLDVDDQSILWLRMKRLADDPGQDPDFKGFDDDGREIDGVIEGVYAIIYYVDHAVKRGCAHYGRPGDDIDSVYDPGSDLLSDGQLAFALLSAGQIFHPQWVRAAVQLLSGAEISPREAVRLATWERCRGLLRSIAEAGMRFDDVKGSFWREIAERLNDTPMPPEGRLPHASRYYIAEGVAPGKRASSQRKIWLRPARQ